MFARVSSKRSPSVIRMNTSIEDTESLMETQDHFASLLGIEPSNWMMWPSERLAILGLLLAIQPKQVLELGCADGGLTRWLSQYSHRVVTVDIDPKIMEVSQTFSNVLPLCMTTESAERWIEVEHKHFDLTIIDADHSKSGVSRDLRNAVKFSDVILVHGTYYPPCREGILDALAGQEIYFNLELVPGGLQPDGMWGGLGIVLPHVPRQKNLHITPRVSSYQVLQRIWKLRESAKAARRSLRSIRGEVGKFRRHAACLGPRNRTK